MPRVMALLLTTGLALARTFQVAAADSDEWPQWRGPNMTGLATSEDPRLPDRWSTTENVAWKAPIPGQGWSSPIVWGNVVFVTTVEASRQIEKPHKGLYLPPTGTERMPDPAPGTHRW